MTFNPQTITAELRQWRLHKIDPVEAGQMRSGIVVGNIHNDVYDLYEDGDQAVIHFTDWYESANFFVAVTPHACVKCPKDEEKQDEGGDVGPSGS